MLRVYVIESSSEIQGFVPKFRISGALGSEGPKAHAHPETFSPMYPKT